MQNVVAKPKAAEILIQRARAQGSVAKTAKGAIAYLKTVKVKAIPGLVALNGRVNGKGLSQPYRRVSFDRALGFTHAVRCNARAEAIVSQLPLERSPGKLIDMAERAATHMTEDVKGAVRLRVLQRIAARLKTELSEQWPYRKSSCTWAGGRHYVNVSFGPNPEAQGWSTRAFSSNGKWSGTDSNVVLTVTERCVRLLDYELIHGGLLAVDAEAVGAREYRVVWVEQARGFGLKLVEGWMVRGFHVKGGNLERARKLATKARAQRAIQLAATKLEGAVSSGLHDLRKVMVMREDSLRAGNCAAGTRAFVKRHEEILAGRKAISATELLSLERSKWTLAAVTHALARHLAESSVVGG